MKRINLTIERIKKATLLAGSKEIFLWDSEQKGLGLRIRHSARHPEGIKTFVYQYRFADKPLRKKIADINEFTIQQARDIAQEYAQKLKAAGINKEIIDPLQNIKQHNPTFYEVASEYLEKRRHGDGKIEPTTFRSWESMTRQLKTRKIGKRPIKVISLKEAKEDFKTFKDTPPWGNRTKTFFSRVFYYAIQEEYRDTLNVWDYIDSYEENPQRRRLLENKDNPEAHEPTLFFRYMKDAMEGKILDGRGILIDPAWIGMTLLNYFTGARPNEICTLKLTEIDYEKNIARKSETKTGAKDILLNSQAIAVIQWAIKVIPRKKGNPYIFAGQYGRGYRKTWNGKQWANLKKATGITAPPYSLRRYFTTVGKRAQLEKDGDIEVVTDIIGHATKAMTELYAGELPEVVEQRRKLLLQENELLGQLLDSIGIFSGSAGEASEV